MKPDTSHLITINKSEWKRDSLMNYLIDSKNEKSMEKILNKFHMLTMPKFDCILSIGGVSNMIASHYGTLSGCFNKINERFFMKHIPSINRCKYSNFLKLDVDVEDKTVLVVDDICTTGATLTETKNILDKAKAKTISFFTVFNITGNTYA